LLKYFLEGKNMADIIENLTNLNRILLKYKKTVSSYKASKNTSVDTLLDFDTMYNNIVVIFNDGIAIAKTLINLINDTVRKDKNIDSIKKLTSIYKSIIDSYCLVGEHAANAIMRLHGLSSFIVTTVQSYSNRRLTMEPQRKSALDTVTNLVKSRSLEQLMKSEFSRKLDAINSILSRKSIEKDKQSAERVKLLSEMIAFITTLNETILNCYSTVSKEKLTDDDYVINYLVSIFEHNSEELSSLLKQVKNVVPTNY
jgi:hypothetical protein